MAAYYPPLLLLLFQATSEHATVYFLAPELVEGSKELSGLELMRSDIYAAGLCVWTLLSRSDPSLEDGK